MSRPRIGLDFDDTLMPTREWMIARLNALHGTQKDPEKLLDIFVSRFWGYSDAAFAAFFQQHSAELHTLLPYEHCVATLRDWAMHADLYIITGRSPDWCAQVPAWLTRHGIVVQDVFSADVRPKGAIAAELGLALYIDDYGPHALSVAEQGIPVYMFDRCYNQDVVHPGIRRMKDWRALAAARGAADPAARRPHGGSRQS
jgi:uncharacterized HAD superfamily protein